MSTTCPRAIAELIRTVGLMASASVLSIILAGEARARYVVNSLAGASLSNLPTGVDVDCTGITFGHTIISSGNSADIYLAAGSNFNSGSVVQNGPVTRLSFVVNSDKVTTVTLLSTNSGSNRNGIWVNSKSPGGSGTLPINGGTEANFIRWRVGSTAVTNDVIVHNVEEGAFEPLPLSAPFVTLEGGTFLTAAEGVTGTFAMVETADAQYPLAVIYQTIMAPSVQTALPSNFSAKALAGADTMLSFIGTIGLTALRHGRGNRLWMSGRGVWGSRSATAATLGYDHDVSGLAGGVDLAVGENIAVGAAVGWDSSDITLGSNGGGGEQSSVLGALNVRIASRIDSSAPRLVAGVAYGRIDLDTLRNVSFNGFSASLAGATQSEVLATFAEAEVPLAERASWTFAASGRAAYVHLSQQAYTEIGTSPLRLTLDDLGTITMEAEGLLSANLSLINGGFAAEDSPESLDLRLDLGARYLAALGDRAIPVSFAASNAGVTLQGDTRDIVQGVGGVALSYTTRSNLSVGLGYQAEIGQRDNHAVRSTISLGF